MDLKLIARVLLITMLVAQPLQAWAADPSPLTTAEVVALPHDGPLSYRPALDCPATRCATIRQFDAMDSGGGGGADDGVNWIVVVIMVVMMIAVAGSGGGGGY